MEKQTKSAELKSESLVDKARRVAEALRLVLERLLDADANGKDLGSTQNDGTKFHM